MNSSRLHIPALAGHEYRAAVRSRILIVLLAILVVVTTVSVYIGAVDYRSQLSDYMAYRAAAQASGLAQVAPSPLAPLSLLRGALEYLEIIGAIIAIALGYLGVSRERTNRTLALVRSRPVSPSELAAGNALGALGLISTLVAVTASVAVVCIGVIGHDWVNGAQAVKLLLAYFSAIVYMWIFYCIGAIATIKSQVAANGLMIALGIWLIVVLIMPQIGDTLDVDNQIPGGLFHALNLVKADEISILNNFKTYEKIRTGIEEASFAQHFQRFAFAMTDVKDKYRTLSLWQLFGKKIHDIEWLVLYSVTFGFGLRHSFKSQNKVPQGVQP